MISVPTIDSQPQPRTDASPATLTDEEIVTRLLAGDAPLYEILMRRYNQRLFRIARGVLKDDGEAEDVVQEAYVRAYRELPSFRGEARFSTWLTRIALHEALARARRRRRLVPLAAPGDGGGPPEPRDLGESGDPARGAENAELRMALQAALEALPESLRTVFLLRDVEGLSTEEAAAALAISPENAKVRLHRARAALRQGLDERIGREVRRLYLFLGERCDRIVAAVLSRLPS